MKARFSLLVVVMSVFLSSAVSAMPYWGGVNATIQRVQVFEDYVYIKILEEYPSISCVNSEADNLYRFSVNDVHASNSMAVALSAYALEKPLTLYFRNGGCDAGGYVPIAGVGL